MNTYSGTTSTAISDREIKAQKIARRLAAESMVLLENNGILPLKKGSRAALYGGGASFTVKGGTGSGMVNNRSNISITEGMKNAGFELTDLDWLEAYEKEYHETYEAWKAHLYAISAPGDRMGLYRAHASNPMVMPMGGPIKKTAADTASFRSFSSEKPSSFARVHALRRKTTDCSATASTAIPARMNSRGWLILKELSIQRITSL